MSSFPFAVRSNIDDLQSFACVLEFEHAHLVNLGKRMTGVVPSFHAADKIAGEFGEAGADEQAHDFVDVVVVFKDQKDGIIWIEQRSRPDREHRGATNIKGARDVGGSESEHATSIDENACFLVHRFLKRFWWKPRDSRQSA